MSYDSTILLCTLLVLVASLTIQAEAYTLYGSRRFVRPVRSAWRPPPPASYYPYPYAAANNEYDDEGPEDSALYSDTVNYYPPPHYYYGRAMDPVDDLQMEMRNEERGADLPIGQETWFESQSAAQTAAAAAERAAANDAFMQNLILAEMYRNDPSQYYGYGSVDDEEKQLKSLSQVKRADVKPQHDMPVTPSVAPATVRPFVGQKEVPMLRPPSPARSQKTAAPAPESPASGGHPPSVYDTIKQLLSLESKQEDHQARRGAPQKRFVSNEESLVHQLSGLKNKVAA